MNGIVTQRDSHSGSIPDDWDLVPLGESVEKIIDFRGRTPKKLGMDWGNGNIPALSANNVKKGHIDFSKECYLGSDALYDVWMNKGPTQKDDIVFTMEAPLGNSALVPDDSKYILSQRVILLRCNESFEPMFFHQYLMSDHFQDILDVNATGTTAKGIQQKRLVKLEVLRPPLPEQKKIASILSTVDNKLDLIDRKITATRTLKKGLMQRLFSQGVGTRDADGHWQPHTEFKDSELGRIPAGWETASMDKVSEITSSKRILQSEYQSEGVPFYRSKEIILKSIGQDFDDEIFIPRHRFNELKNKFGAPRKGDILITAVGTIGRSYLVGNEEFYFKDGNLIWLTSIRNDVVPEFLLYLLRSDSVQDAIETMSAGSSQSALTIVKLKGLTLPLPSVDEQKKIVEILSTANVKLQRLTALKRQTQHLKQGLMQKLLTGQWRVNV